MLHLVQVLDSAARLANAIAIVAAPKCYELARQTASWAQIRSELLRHIDEFDGLSLDGITSGGAQLLALKGAATSLRTALIAAPDDEKLSEVVALARAALSAFGIPEPADGWDKFTPPRETE